MKEPRIQVRYPHQNPASGMQPQKLVLPLETEEAMNFVIQREKVHMKNFEEMKWLID